MRVGRCKPAKQKGYVLLSLMLLMTLMMITLTVEAPRVAQQIKREKEEELIHRGNEYKNAIKKFFRKVGRYPLTLDQLENTNNMRFLRKRYKDPFTGKDDWRLLHVGEVQLNVATGGTNVPGQPIGQPIGGQSIGGTIGQPGTGAVGTATPNPGLPSIGQSTSSPASGVGPTSSLSIGGNTGFLGSPSGSGQFGGGPIIGVSSTSKLASIKEPDGKNHYNEWPPFVYDPRLEQQQMLAPGASGIAGANPLGGAPAGQGPGQTPGPGFGQQGPSSMMPPKNPQ